MRVLLSRRRKRSAVPPVVHLPQTGIIRFWWARPTRAASPGGADAAASVGRADAPAPRPGLPWADLLRRVYDIDISTCPNCAQGRLEPIATILDPDVIARILAAMDRFARAPRAPP
ncbi:MAG: hypothetical protein ACKOGH_12295, partial [Alphaproteobacteria bacterium]